MRARKARPFRLRQGRNPEARNVDADDAHAVDSSGRSLSGTPEAWARKRLLTTMAS